MSSIREQVIAAAVTALNASRPVNVPVFVRSRASALDPSALPANEVYPIGEKPSEPGGRLGPIAQRPLILRLAFLAKSSGSTSGDTAIDPSYVWAVTVLCAATRFSSLVISCVEAETTFAYDEQDAAVVMATTDFRVEFATLRTNPEAQS